jgi:hypothetical protein
MHCHIVACSTLYARRRVAAMSACGSATTSDWQQHAPVLRRYCTMIGGRFGLARPGESLEEGEEEGASG